MFSSIRKRAAIRCNGFVSQHGLNGGQCFAFVYFSFLLFGCFVACSLQPRLAQGGKMTL
jgi:hypothetical protein